MKTPPEIADEVFDNYKKGKATKEEAVDALNKSIEYLERQIREKSA